MIPGGLAGRQFAPSGMLMRQQSQQREQSQQSRRRAHDRQIRPLALGLEAQMLANFMEGDFQLPSENEPFHDLHRLDVQVRAQQGLGLELALRVADQHPTNRHDRLTAMPPNRGAGNNFNNPPTCSIPLRDGGALPARLHVRGHLDQSRQALPFQTRTTWLMRPPRWGGLIQGRGQTKANDHAEGLGQLLHSPQQGNHGKTAVGDDDQGPARQPAAQLQEALPRPVGQLLVRPRLLLIVAFRRGQQRHAQRGKAQTRLAHGSGPKSIQFNHRRPLAPDCSYRGWL